MAGTWLPSSGGQARKYYNHLYMGRVLIIIFLSFLEKRKSRQDICYGRPALIIPFRFIDGYENRIAYAMAFGTTTNSVVSLITSQQTAVYVFPLAVKALDVYLQAMIGCLTCFPLFACLTTRYKALGASLCIVYSLWWAILSVSETFQNVTGNSTSSLLGVQFAVTDTITVDIAFACRVLQGLPIVVCYLVLIAYCVRILWNCYTSKTYITKGLESTVQPHQEEHVRWVLRKFQLKKSHKPGSISHESVVNNLSSQTFVEQMRSSFKLRHFTNFPFFKYPTRIIALACVQLNVLYWFSLLLLAGTTTVLYLMIHAEFTKHFINQFSIDLLIIISGCSCAAVVFSVTNALVQIFIGFRNYRLDMLSIYQGNKTFIPVRNETSQYILTRSMTFPGFQIAFMMWGIVLSFAAVLLMSLIPVLIIYFLAQFEILDDIAVLVLQLLSFPTSVLFFFYLQVFVAKLILLQRKIKTTDRVPPLNIDNRKLYELLNYYSLFTNLAVGVFTCLWRITESAIIGTISVGRLDRSVYTRENETADRGYAAYTSMLLVDNAHNNPCMRVFAHLLWTKILAARIKQVQSQEEMSEHTVLKLEDKIRYGSTADTCVLETPTTADTCVTETPTTADTCVTETPTTEDTCVIETPTTEDTCVTETPTTEDTFVPETPTTEDTCVPETPTTEDTWVPDTPTTADTKGGPWTFCELSGTGTSKRAETRWQLAYTLINNPQLCKLRKQRLAKDLCKIPSILSEEVKLQRRST